MKKITAYYLLEDYNLLMVYTFCSELLLENKSSNQIKNTEDRIIRSLLYTNKINQSFALHLLFFYLQNNLKIIV